MHFARMTTVAAAALLAFATACSSCRQAETPEAPPPTPLPPPQKIEPEIWIYGHVDRDVPWQSALYDAVRGDIAAGLEARAPDTAGMVRFEGGTTTIGCAEPFRSPEDCLPAREVTVAPYWLDKTEVTREAYRACVEAHQCLPTVEVPEEGALLDPTMPVIVNFAMGRRYCLWRGRRLPTEAEWEFAARGAAERTYPWGDEPPAPDRANICGAECVMDWKNPNWKDGYATASPVGAFPAGDTPEGLTDMGGNLKEWVEPLTPPGENERIARGASWSSDMVETHASCRQVWRPQVRVDDKGVRCAADGK